YLGVGRCEREEDQIARRHIRDGYACANLLLRAPMRHGDLIGGQRAAAEGPQIDVHHPILAATEVLCDAARRLKLALVPLAVAKRQSVEIEARLGGERQRGRRIESAREQDHRGGTLLAHTTPLLPNIHDTMPNRGHCPSLRARGVSLA